MSEKTPLELATEEAAAAFELATPPPGPLMAARVGDPHICPMLDGLKPHVGGTILAGCPTVLIGGMMAARVTDLVACASPAPDSIAKGSLTVMIGGLSAARFMDPSVHGGMIVAGCPTVIIGDVGMGKTVTTEVGGTPLNKSCMSQAKATCTPFVKPAKK